MKHKLYTHKRKQSYTYMYKYIRTKIIVKSNFKPQPFKRNTYEHTNTDNDPE